jgi:hypothetical protein
VPAIDHGAVDDAPGQAAVCRLVELDPQLFWLQLQLGASHGGQGRQAGARREPEVHITRRRRHAYVHISGGTPGGR